MSNPRISFRITIRNIFDKMPSSPVNNDNACETVINLNTVNEALRAVPTQPEERPILRPPTMPVIDDLLDDEPSSNDSEIDEPNNDNEIGQPIIINNLQNDNSLYEYFDITLLDITGLNWKVGLQVTALEKERDYLMGICGQLAHHKNLLLREIQNNKEVIEAAQRISKTDPVELSKFTCHICMTYFIDQSLKCQHYLCSRCLLDMLKTNQTFCPFYLAENGLKDATTLFQ